MLEDKGTTAQVPLEIQMAGSSQQDLKRNLFQKEEKEMKHNRL